MTSSSSQGGGAWHIASASMDASTKSFLTSSCDDQDGDDCVFIQSRSRVVIAFAYTVDDGVAFLPDSAFHMLYSVCIHTCIISTLSQYPQDQL